MKDREALEYLSSIFTMFSNNGNDNNNYNNNNTMDPLIRKLIETAITEMEQNRAETKKMREEMTVIRNEMAELKEMLVPILEQVGRDQQSGGSQANTGSNDTNAMSTQIIKSKATKEGKSYNTYLKHLINTVWNKNPITNTIRTTEQVESAYNSLVEDTNKVLLSIRPEDYKPMEQRSERSGQVSFDHVKESKQEEMVEKLESLASANGIHLRNCKNHWGANLLLSKFYGNANRKLRKNYNKNKTNSSNSNSNNSNSSSSSSSSNSNSNSKSKSNDKDNDKDNDSDNDSAFSFTEIMQSAL
ncbi:unnamed protein product [Absidia cylindrospora]